jgi:hypothetical protein
MDAAQRLVGGGCPLPFIRAVAEAGLLGGLDESPSLI